jgi:hypothetical protein
MSNKLKSSKNSKSLSKTGGKSSDALPTSTTLIQNDLPKLCINEKQTDDAGMTPLIALQMSPSSSELKWKFLKNNLQSAVSEWSELENSTNPKKTPEEEQLEKMRSLISNIKDRLLEF